MNDSEEHVKQVLEAFLKGSRLDFKPAQSNGEYDFDLTYNDGNTAALEVTRTIDETWVETGAAVRNKNNGGSTFIATKCRKSWIIFVTQHSPINKIRQHADEYLAELESANIDSFDCLSPRQQLNKIRSLGIVSGFVFSAGTDPTIRIAGPLGGGAVGASLAINAGENEASKEDNRKKLGGATTDECHLAVYFGGGNPSAWTALTCGTFAPPDRLPNIPKEITHIWLIGSPDSEHKNTFTIWYANKNENWRSASVVLPETPIQLAPQVR